VEAFPFTNAEWDPLKDLALSVLNAHSAEDDVLAASLTLEMLDRVNALRARHGDHPVLLETAADYTADPTEQAALYRRAVELAGAHGLPTLSIRLSLTPVLVELGEPIAALEELRACGGEAAGGSADERERWVWELERVARDAAGDAQRGGLYRRAAGIAEMHGLPALRIRLSLARFLLDVGDPAAAREELRLCRAEVPEGGEDDRAWWADLLDEAGRAEPGAAPDRDGIS
jgi:hypothetical protein